MTKIETPRLQASPASELLSPRPRARMIAVGVRDADHDAATIDWALSEAWPCVDIVHIVHAYRPVRLAGCTWEPVARARDARYVAAKHRAALAAQRATLRAAHERAQVDVSVIAGEPSQVLDEMSDIVDLIVIGDDSAAPQCAGKIAWRVQDAARCPVVCVPPGVHPASALPVTLVLDTGRLPAESVFEFAAEAARRHGVTLRVSRACESVSPGQSAVSRAVAEHQTELDAQLADWVDRYPHLGIVSRIELATDWLSKLRAQSSLLVAGTGSAAAVRDAAVHEAACPTAIVPDDE